jgi:hypothetical protein
MKIGKALLDSTGIAALLHTMGASATEVKAAADVITDLEIGKATEGMTSQSLDAGQIVQDRWHQGQGHTVPGAEKIKIGPVQEASGGGAEKMVAEYSHPAPQVHLQMEAERLAAEMGSMRGYMRSHAEAIGKLAKSQETVNTVLTALLTKAASEEEEGAVPGEASSFFEWHARKAGQFLRATKSVLNKAVQIKDGLDELPTPEAKKAAKGQFRDLRKKAARLGLSALAASYAAKSEEADPAADTLKALHDMMEEDHTLKADIAALHDKDREKDEEKRAKKAMKKLARKAKKIAAKKAEKAAAKAAAEAGTITEGGVESAKGDDKGNQADKQKPENKNQDDSAKKALDAEMLGRIEAALKGIEPLAGSVPQVMEILAGRPVTQNVTQPLALMKADAAPDTLMAIDQRIDEAVANGKLDGTSEMRARDLLQKVTLVKAGVMSEEMWKSNVKQSPISVQEIFREAA